MNYENILNNIKKELETKGDQDTLRKIRKWERQEFDKMFDRMKEELNTYQEEQNGISEEEKEEILFQEWQDEQMRLAEQWEEEEERSQGLYWASAKDNSESYLIETKWNGYHPTTQVIQVRPN